MTRFSRNMALATAVVVGGVMFTGQVQAKCKSCSGSQPQAETEDGCKAKKEPSFKKQFKEMCSPVNCSKKGKTKKK